MTDHNGTDHNGSDTDADRQDQDVDDEIDGAVDTEESGAGYGNHGDAQQGDATGSEGCGQAGVSGGMSDTDRG